MLRDWKNTDFAHLGMAGQPHCEGGYCLSEWIQGYYLTRQDTLTMYTCGVGQNVNLSEEQKRRTWL